MNGNLYIVSTPIGNYQDITIRAVNILKDSDEIICEELKPARRFLSEINIQKDLRQINEHNEKEETPEIINLLKSGKNLALISDCGTPLFSDPGLYLVQNAINAGIKIIPVPGANSLLPALVSSGFNLKNFYYYGWLSAKKDERKAELKKLKNIKELIVVMETPYRLQRIIDDFLSEFGNDMQICLAYKLTMPEENIFRGTISDIKKVINKMELKGEFVLIADNRKKN